jgi:hypothetical protein
MAKQMNKHHSLRGSFDLVHLVLAGILLHCQLHSYPPVVLPYLKHPSALKLKGNTAAALYYPQLI